jgi:hypothetical protein
MASKRTNLIVLDVLLLSLVMYMGIHHTIVAQDHDTKMKYTNKLK